MWVNSTFQLYWCEMWCGKFIPFRHTACGLEYFPHSLTNFFFRLGCSTVFFFIFLNRNIFHVFCFKHSYFDGILRCRWEKCLRMRNRGSSKTNSPKDLKKVILNEEFPFLLFLVVFLLASIENEKFPMLINVREAIRMKFASICLAIYFWKSKILGF